MNFGRCPGNPVNLCSNAAVKRFLDHMLTDKGFHILYHRSGSLTDKDNAVVDHYEIISGEGIYDDLFINTHHEMNIWIPPDGYLFDKRIELKRLDWRGYDQSYTAEREITVEERFIYQDKWPEDWEEIMRVFQELPPLERYLYCSSGEDHYVVNFPFPLINEILDNLDFKISSSMKEWIVSAIIPRKC
jgi:hypothetical protein